MWFTFLLGALFGVANAAHILEDQYAINRDTSPMALLARDFMPHIRTREQLRLMEVQLKANMNQYIDRLLSNARTYFIGNNLDPMKLPDYNRSFNKKVLGITWYGELKVNNGHLQDLATIYRSGNVNIDYKDKILMIDANIGLKDLQFNHDFSAKFMGMGPKGYVVGKGEGIIMQFKFHVDLNKQVAGLDLFDIKNIKLLSAELYGLGAVVDWLLDSLADLVLSIFKGPIVNLIENKVGIILAELIARLDIGSYIPQVYV